jgi:hypothetical protein
VIEIARVPEAATAGLHETVPNGSRLVSCPLCHTTDASMTHDALDAGADWLCSRCGQGWDARRLATVAAYAASPVGRDHERR